MSNPFAALLGETSVPSTSLPSEPTKLCQQLEQIFGFSLHEQRSRKKHLIYLEDQATAFPGRDLDVEILEHALFERLFLNNPKALVDGNKLDDKRFEGKVVIYLYHCFTNNLHLKDADLRNAVQSLILRNVLTSLKQPELYPEQDLSDQFVEAVLSAKDQHNEFFDVVYQEFLQDEDGVDAMYEPYTNILKKLHIKVAKATITTVNHNILDWIHLFSKHDHLGNILMDYTKPIKEDGIEYANTILGALLCLSTLPKTAHAPFEYFADPLDQASNSATESMLYANTEKVVQFVHSLLLSLLKCNGEVRAKVMRWLGACLKANVDRGKIWNSQISEALSATTVNDGFMLNLCSILVRLCQPFCQPDNRLKILKVDPTYCAVTIGECEAKGIHLLNMSSETCLVPPEDDQQNQRITSNSYNFVTECFYMSHRSFDLGFKVIVDKLVKLNQDLGRIERAYNDAINQSGGRSEIVETIKQRMTSDMSRYLSMKSALSEPHLLEMLFNLASSTSYWFNQVAVSSGDGRTLTDQTISFPITGSIPESLKCIPEFIVENVVSYLVFLRRFNPRVFEERGYEQLKPIATFVLIYMGSPRFMKNPHLRARLAEGLEALLPFHKDEPAGLNTLGSYQREMIFSQHEHKKEFVRSLLEVFVGIEMTGQSVQFEQKFNYRRPMYLIMDYLWSLPEQREFFRLLANEAEANMEAVTPPLFLRFVNLLMNDAVYLLDESLSNMSKIKEMETARENGDWDRLPMHERAQNQGYLQHVGMIAKFNNILGRDTIKSLERLTSEITAVFTHPTMVDRVAAMLNYFLLNLVGPNQKNFKVKDQKEYSFKPADTVLNICKIYVNLKQNEPFCLAVSQDGRSYSPRLFGLAQDVLVRIGGGALIGELQDVAGRVTAAAEAHQVNEDAVAEAPDHFLDPIMSTLMTDPVILPSSKQTVDRTTIARHLLSDQTDPFNRSPLTMDQVIPNGDLAAEIHRWLAEKKAARG